MSPTAALDRSGLVRDNGAIVLSEQDDRVYRHVTLPNQMQALLIHDPKADKEAAAMDVLVGSLCDPPSLLGLAHFCEHMLFLGSEKYPDEKSYSEFVSKNGGRLNAYTGCEHTNYFFDVTAGNLSEALDRFSRFFIDPLFTESATNRELHAVDNEHASYLQNDAWRVLQVLKSISSDEHPWHQFDVGNIKTLRKDPQEAGLDVRAELLKFHARYYSANLMRLVILGQAGLDELQEMVVDKFSPVIARETLEENGVAWERVYQLMADIPHVFKSASLNYHELISKVVNSNAPSPAFLGKQSFGPNQVQRRLNIVPVVETRQICVKWPMPPLFEHFRSKPAGYVGRLLHNEGSGSLVSVLKRKGWANRLYSYLSHSCSEWSIFSVIVSCTDSGMVHVNEIVTMIYQYVNIIREQGLQEWIYLEWKRLWDLSFRFASKPEPMWYVSNLAGSLHTLPPDLSVAGNRLILEYNTDIVREILSGMVPSNMLLVVVDKELKGTTNQVEPWYGTQYSCEPLPEDLLQSWEACGKHHDMRLPQPNPFIATDFTLRTAPSSSAPPTSPGEAPSPPLLIRDDPLCRLWYKTDATYNMPKLNVYMRMITPVVYESPESSVLANLMTALLMEDMRDELYFAQQSGLTVSVYATNNELQLHVMGYSDKARTLLKHMIDRMHTIAGSPEDDSDHDGADHDGADHDAAQKQEEGKKKEGKVAMFIRLREELKKKYKSREFNSPISHARGYTRTALLIREWTDDEVMATLEGPGITPAAMRAFAPRVLDMLHVEMFVHGNATDDEAKELASAIVDGIGFRPLPTVMFPQDRVVDLGGHTEPTKQQQHQQQHTGQKKQTADTVHPESAQDTNSPGMAADRMVTSADPSTEGEGRVENADGWETSEAIVGGTQTEERPRGVDTGAVVVARHFYPEYRRSAVCPNPEEANNAVELSFQLCVDDGGRNAALLSLLAHLVKQKFFDQLRTKEQLGYIVYSRTSTYGATVMHMDFIIQSSEKTPAYLDDRIEAFIAGFRGTLSTTTPEAFSSSIAARRRLMLKRNERLSSETGRHWSEIYRRTYDFGKKERIAACLSELTLADVLDFYDQYLALNAPERRKIAGWAHGAMFTAELSKDGKTNREEDDQWDGASVAVESVEAAAGVGEGRKRGRDSGAGCSRDQEKKQESEFLAVVEGRVSFGIADGAERKEGDGQHGLSDESIGGIGKKGKRTGGAQDGGEPTMQHHYQQGQDSNNISTKKMKRRVIMIEDYDEFRRSRPLYPALISSRVKLAEATALDAAGPEIPTV